MIQYIHKYIVSHKKYCIVLYFIIMLVVFTENRNWVLTLVVGTCSCLKIVLFVYSDFDFEWLGFSFFLSSADVGMQMFNAFFESIDKSSRNGKRFFASYLLWSNILSKRILGSYYLPAPIWYFQNSIEWKQRSLIKQTRIPILGKLRYIWLILSSYF